MIWKSFLEHLINRLCFVGLQSDLSLILRFIGFTECLKRHKACRRLSNGNMAGIDLLRRFGDQIVYSFIKHLQDNLIFKPRQVGKL